MILLQIAFLFTGVFFFNLVSGIQLLNIHDISHQSLYLFVPVLLHISLAGLVLVLVNGVITVRDRDLSSCRQELDQINGTLAETVENFEERVKRRTFEISVANGSLHREIAERIQTEEESRQLRRQMELILDSAGEGIFGLDTVGNVTFINKAASLMLGWPPHELIGQSHHDLIHHTHADGSLYPVEECPIHKAYKDGKVHFGSDEVFWSNEGVSFPVEYISTPILENERLSGAVVVFRDLTVFNS